MKKITIHQLESAINYWREREPGDAHSIGPVARHLATPYGLMIYNRQQTIDIDSLDQLQIDAIHKANVL